MGSSANRRAIGVARVSAEGRRTKDRPYSYDEPSDTIEASCERDDLELLWIGREKNVSGGADLANQPELSKAVAAIEAGETEIVVSAYFDRFLRSLSVQHEVVTRVEAAAGELLASDHGTLTNGSGYQEVGEEARSAST